MKRLRLALALLASAVFAQTPKVLPPIQRFAKPTGGTALAVRANDAPLVFIGQIFSADVSGEARLQAEGALDALARALEKAGSSVSHVVRLNAYVSSDLAVDAVEASVAARFAAAPPAFTLVRTSLRRAGALVAFEAVAVTSTTTDTVRIIDQDAAVLPAGGKMFISGQAEKGADLATATRLTMAGLQRSLAHLGLGKADVVQVKAFIRPMNDHAAAQREIAASFGGAPPPVVLVEWQSDLFAEIELVVSARALPAPAGGSIAFVTLPWLNQSLRYSHACHVAANTPLIFVGEITGGNPGEARAQLKTAFERLGSVLFESGSSYRTLVKATYYLGDPKARALLGDIRAVYFDPTRAPAASALGVTGFARAGRVVSLDVIAVPVAK